MLMMVMIGDNYGDDDKLLSRNALLTKGVKSYFQPRSLPEILTTVNVRHVTDKI